MAIAASTLTTVIVFLPIVFINKEIRILYMGFALTISFSLLASLWVALSVVPLLASRLFFLVKVSAPRPLRICTWSRHLIANLLRWRGFVGAIAFLVCVLGFGFYQTIPKEFLGTAEAEDFTVFVELPSGAKLEISDEVVGKIEKLLTSVPEIKSVSSQVEK